MRGIDGVRDYDRSYPCNRAAIARYRACRTDFATVTEAQLDAVADEPNDRPRKRLGFAKPIEEISELLLH